MVEDKEQAQGVLLLDKDEVKFLIALINQVPVVGTEAMNKVVRLEKKFRDAELLYEVDSLSEDSEMIME